MYRYDEFDQKIVDERVSQFRGQVERRLAGDITEDEFKPLRLMNGLYLQLHAYMLRVAIPYGTMTADQLRMLAHIARKYDKGYGHFTTRQNIQYNWPKLSDTPDILAELAKVEMHAFQTSGNCIRNVTSDQYAGVADGEVEDPRPYAEILRQWSTMHPEFTYLPRKFKIAITGQEHDRAAIRFHDIGLEVVRNDAGEVGFKVFVGGGLGRTPMVGKEIRSFLPKKDFLSYMEAILRTYNEWGRRDNKYKARIKITVHENGLDKFKAEVEEEWETIRDGNYDLPEGEINRIKAYFQPPAYETLSNNPDALTSALDGDTAFKRWFETNTDAHKVDGYRIVNISLKPIGGIPGDITDDQMEAVAALTDKYSLSELRATHEQNLTLPYVKQDDLFELWKELHGLGLATPNIGKVSDMIACPGLDYCALANARAIPVAQRISTRFEDLKRQHDIGELKLKISGCINACGHHHVGHIGILGVDKKGEEFYQVTLGGDATEGAAIGKITGPAFSYTDIVGAIETVVETYIDLREDDEEFLQTYARVGMAPFKEKLYAPA